MDASHAHDHDDKKYFVNQEELNLYLDNAQNRMGLMIKTVADIANAKLTIRYISDEKADTMTGKFPYMET